MKSIHVAVTAGCVALIVTSSSVAIRADQVEQKSIEPPQPLTVPDTATEPKPVRTIVVPTGQAPTLPTETRTGRPSIIRTDQERTDAAQPPKTPEALTEPKRVRTIIMRTDEVERERIKAEQKRVDAEQKRIEAELRRMGAELKRIGPAQPPRAATNPKHLVCIGKDYSEDADPRPREAACLTELRRSALRPGDLLALQLENGAIKTYQTARVACEGYPCARYWLVGYHPTARLYMIKVGYWEGYGGELVDARSGKTVSLPDVPHFSPDGSSFIAIDNDEGYGGSDDIVMGSTVTDPPTVVWRQSRRNLPLEWDFQRWVDNDRISLRVFRVGVSRRCLDDEGCDAIVVRSGTTWTVQRPAWTQN
jgi:hypothetical protein